MATTRLEMRVPQEIKELAEKSSALLGNASLTEFVIQAIREKASRVLTEANVITLSNQQFDVFMAACEHSGKPSKQLLEAAKTFDDAGYK
ncbi:MAG: DUF1778 domain-containing protein [Thiohalomonadales bacterium]